MSQQYLEDHLIKDHLRRLDEAVIKYQWARAADDYGTINFTLGMMSSLAGLVYTRNAQIDLENREGECAG